VFWIGDHHDLQIGRKLLLFNDDSEWVVTARWTSLPLLCLPPQARIGFVEEIF
jgi:hypothetical protein